MKTKPSPKPITIIRISLIILSFVTFFSSKAADYYWVGGSGNWSDYANHWATTSGGTIFHTSIPSLNDDVYFDGNSTMGNMILTLDTTFMSCKNMEWSGITSSITIMSSNADLNIYGSLKLLPNMNINVQRINFLGSGNNSLLTLGNELDTLYFEGPGFYELLDSLTCKGLYIYNDSFATNSFTVDANKIAIGHTMVTVNVDLSNSTIICETDFEAFYGNINLNSSNSTIIFNNALYSGADMKVANKIFKNIFFQTGGRILGGVTCERLKVNNNFSIENLIFYTTVCQTIELGGSGDLEGTITVDTLIMINPGTILKVDSININNYFSAIGICDQLITLIPRFNLSSGTIYIPSTGSMNIEYCIITSINTAGGANFVADNSIDGGGNSGWTINSPVPRTLYWIGGNGNWTDENNWSQSSGGSGGECLPSLIDDVVFDNNSFAQQGDTVKIDAQVFCRNMNWIGVNNNPSIGLTVSSLNKVSVFGSLNLDSNMTIIPNFTFEFVGSDTGNTIFTAGKYIKYLRINGVGSWSLSNQLNCESINIYKGTFNTNNYDLQAKAISANGVNNQIFVNFGFSNLFIEEDFDAFSPALTINSSNSNLIVNNNSGESISCQFFDIIFNEVYVYKFGYFSGKITCNKFEAFSKINLGDLTVGSVIFHETVSGKKFEADSMLIMADAKQLAFDTLIINNSFINTNDCTNPLLISRSLMIPAVFIKTTGIINLNYVYLSGVQAIGGAVFNATNSWDLGGNSGWNIITPAPRNLYWVGGAGDWDDPNHWSLTSGGVPGNCQPNMLDNIYFDINSLNSGDTIKLKPSSSVYVKNLNFLNVPPTVFIIADNFSSIFINGSLTLTPEVDLINIRFNMISSLSGNTIITGNNIFGITISGAGEWHLLENLNGTLYLKNGSFYTNGWTINGNFYASYNTATIDFDTSTVICEKFISESSVVTILGNNANIIVNSNFNPEFKVNNGFFNSVTFLGEVETEWDFSCNKLMAHGEFTNINSQITAGYAEFKDNVTLPQPFSADSVVFDNPGKLIKLSSLTVNNYLETNGNGGFPIQIEGINGSGTINKSSGYICLDYVWLKDINATGGAQFFAGANSVDLGGNSGWNFSVCSPVTDVWPGDANYDLIADNNDILNIGLAYGYNGPVRQNASLLWVAQPAQDWVYQFAAGTNLKHADTDGNGVVNIDDTLAVSLNYGLTHPLKIQSPEQSNLLPLNLYSVINPDTASLSDTVDVEIYLGTNTFPVDSIYGIAFTVNFDTSLIDTNYLDVNYSGCWMGTSSVDLIPFHKNLLSDGSVDFAIVRTDQQNTSGFGFLTKMGIVVVDNIGAKITTYFTISDVKAITASEYILPVTTAFDSLVIDTTGVVGINNYVTDKFNINVYPNPVKDELFIISDQIIESYEIMNILGIEVESKKIGSKNTIINIAQLSQGTYLLRLTTKSGIITRKIQVLKH